MNDTFIEMLLLSTEASNSTTLGQDGTWLEIQIMHNYRPLSRDVKAAEFGEQFS